MEENKKRQITLAILGGIFLLILVIGAAYSYFQVVANNNATVTTITGNSELVGQATLTTNISALKLNITAEMMHSSNVNTTYYATEDGTPVTTATDGSGIYTLATASITESEVTLDCTYSFDIKLASELTKKINDESSDDFVVVIIEPDGTKYEYSLTQIILGVTHTGYINRLTYGTNQTVKIKAYVTNTESNQNDLSGNSISIAIVPKSGTEGFSCDTSLDIEEAAKGKDFAQFLVDNNTRIRKFSISGLEGDGYRFVGSGSYDSATTPSNFICFGTTNKTECKNNESKYMYRIIGVFYDSIGSKHLKLISFKQLASTYEWHTDYQTNVAWENSDMYSGLNGSYFLNNTTYDYMQNSTWLNKIENWTWSAVNTKTYSDSGPDYETLTISEIYLHEMNKSGKLNTIGEWTTPSAKIGLMYVSDYALSLGSNALNYNSFDNASNLKTGWMHYSNNGMTDESTNYGEWTMTRTGLFNDEFLSFAIQLGGSFGGNSEFMILAVRPTFYLTSGAKITSGDGSYENPYILSE